MIRSLGFLLSAARQGTAPAQAAPAYLVDAAWLAGAGQREDKPSR